MAWSARPKVLNTALNLVKCEYGNQNAKENIIRGRYEIASSLYKKDLYSHYGCVNAIEFSANGQFLVSGGDDRRVLIWDVEKAISGCGQPSIMKGEHNSNIFCLGFNANNTRLFSAGNDEQVMIHDAKTGETIDVILHDEAIYGLSVDPFNDYVFATACDDGRIFVWDIREPNLRDPLTLIRSQSAFHAVMHNPVEPRLIATANSKEGIGLWDIRKPKSCLLQYNGGVMSSQSAMSVRFNSRGTQILSLRRRLPPILYNVTSPYPVAEFDHAGYYNSCTMKSCSFAGNEDQYILSGSDDFKLYMWKIPSEIFDQELSSPTIKWVDKAHMILRGHRSIVNQVRFNYSNSIIASSGVEKIIKLWSVFPLPYGTGGIDLYSNQENRKVYSHEDYINLVLQSGQFMTHDYSHQSVQEDPRMMAFFDSLVQRDIEGWTSDSSEESTMDEGRATFVDYCYSISRGSSNSEDSLLESDQEDPLRIVNQQTLSYINLLNDRIELTTQTSGELPPDEPEESPQSTEYDPSTGLNKITQLINEKKKDQLRKVVRNTLRTTKKRLKKVKRHYEASNSAEKSDHQPSTSAQSNNQPAIQKQLEKIQSLLEDLSQRVGIGNPAENKVARNNSIKLRRRLQMLTNQSDFILNDVLSERSSDSDSDSSDLMNGEDFLEAVNSEVQRMRHILPNGDTDDDCSSNSSSSSSGSSSSSSSSSNRSSAGRAKRGRRPASSSSSSSVFERENHLNHNGLSESERDTDGERTPPAEVPLSFDDDTETNSRCDGSPKNGTRQSIVLEFPLLNSKCHPANSTIFTNNAHGSEDERPNSSVAFKSINHSNRSYRKRKHEEGSTSANPEENGEMQK